MRNFSNLCVKDESYRVGLNAFKGLGGSVAELVTPMQFASGLLRAMSPVAGVIIAVAGAAGVSPMAIVRRTWIPMILGIITAIIANEIFIG